MAFIEAKHLGEALERPQHEDQLFTYALRQQVKFAALTDGNRWLLDDVSVFSGGERRLLQVSITDPLAHETALKLLLLWRRNLASGQPAVANAPVVDIPPEPSPVPDHPSTPGDWIPLINVEAGKGKKPPKTIKLTGEELRPIKSWVEVLIEVAEWLVKVGRLTAAHRPTKGLSFINSTPTRLKGTLFSEYREISGGLYLNTDLTAVQIVNCSQRLLTHYDINPQSVELLFE